MTNVILCIVALLGIFIASAEAENMLVQMVATIGGGCVGVGALLLLAKRGWA